MTPSKAAKEAGLKTLKQASEISGFSTRTLENYYNDQPQKFKVIIDGCVVNINRGWKELMGL